MTSIHQATSYNSYKMPFFVFLFIGLCITNQTLPMQRMSTPVINKGTAALLATTNLRHCTSNNNSKAPLNKKRRTRKLTLQNRLLFKLIQQSDERIYHLNEKMRTSEEKINRLDNCSWWAGLTTTCFVFHLLFHK